MIDFTFVSVGLRGQWSGWASYLNALETNAPNRPLRKVKMTNTYWTTNFHHKSSNGGVEITMSSKYFSTHLSSYARWPRDPAMHFMKTIAWNGKHGVWQWVITAWMVHNSIAPVGKEQSEKLTMIDTLTCNLSRGVYLPIFWIKFI